MKKKPGARLKYQTIKKLKEAVEEYFDDVRKNEKRPTMSGLALHLGLSRQGLLDYANRDGYGQVVQWAKQRVEVSFEEALYGTSVSGVIFNLKNNFGWKDKQEIEQHNTHKVDMSNLSDEELERIAKGG